MTEILTESFCERCGTRYTFESATRRKRMKGVRVLSRGLKNFVLSDDTSMDEAMAAARNETDREQTTHQLDAFHKTFNFCMSCRQYTCPNCWNEAEARCLTCAPHLGREVLPAPFPDLPTNAMLAADVVYVDGTNGSRDPEATAAAFELAEGEATDSLLDDDGIDVFARLDTLTGPPLVVVAPVPSDALEPEEIASAGAVTVEPDPRQEAEPVAVAEPIAEPAVEAELASGAAGESEVVAEAAVESEVEPAVAGEGAGPDLADLAAAAIVVDALIPDQTAASPGSGAKPTGRAAARRRFRPGQSLDEELDAYERERISALATAAAIEAPTSEAMAGQDVETALEAVAESEGAPEPEIAPEPEVAAEIVAVEPEVAAEPEIAAEIVAVEPEVAAEPVPIADDLIEQPTWRMIAPDPSADVAPVEPVGPVDVPAAATADPGAEPQWPTRPEWLGGSPAVGLPFLGRPAAPTGGLEALWAESTRDVVAGPTPDRASSGIQPCISCGLSLSATARFCRRCGTSQPR
jgi:hypothetical protein